MKKCNCDTTKIPILETDVYPQCPPDKDKIYIYLREFEDTYKLYGYTHTKTEFRLDDLEPLTLKVEGVTKIIYDGDVERTFDITRDDLDVYSKQEIINLLSSSGIIVLNTLTSDSTTAALSAAKGKELQQNKVDKVSGKELSSNDFTNIYKTKLDSIQSGAQPNPNLKTVNNISLYASGSDTNINIAKGDYTSIIFRQSETQPATPTGTASVPSGWSTTITSSTGTWWMSSSLINGQTNQASTWSVPIKMVGTNGNSITYVFKQGDTRPATPTGAAPIPSGWSDAPTAVGKWWMSKATVSGQTGLVIGSWSVPVQTTAEDGIDGNYTDFKYAANSSTTVPPTLNNSVRNPPGWSDYPPSLTTTTYLWMTQATIVEDALDGTWSVPVRISGENGKDGQWTSFVFRQSEAQPATPSGTSIIPSGWTDAPSGTGVWWMSKSLINYLGQAIEWTIPVRVTGNDGPQGVGIPGADGVTYYTWIRYADTVTGGGISNDPTGKEYIGFAYNKTTSAESNNPADYTWSLIKGTDGQPGAPGSNTYTWIKYSDYADGTGMYDLPTPNTQYIGIAVNKTTSVESTNKADYTWSKFKGDNGNWTSYAFKQQTDQPATPTDTTIIPSGWSDRPTSTGKWWMIKATISGSSNTVIGTWSTPVQVTAEDGVDGNYTDFKYAVNTSLTVTPTIDRNVRNPSGWTDTPPTLSEDQYLWLTQATINPDNTLSGQWSIPVRISGESGKDGEYTVYQYAKNTSLTVSPTTGWTSTPPSLSTGEYLWMRMGVVTPPATAPTSWSVPVRISGENGQTGEVGAMLVFMGFWSNSETYTGTPSLRHIVRVDSGATTTYYIAKTTAGTFTGNLPTDTSKWETFEANYKSIATEVLFAAGANIAGWVFRIDDPGTPNEQQYLQSQNGRAVLNGTKGSIELQNNGNKLVLDTSILTSNYMQFTHTTGGIDYDMGSIGFHSAGGSGSGLITLNSYTFPSEDLRSQTTIEASGMESGTYVAPNTSGAYQYGSILTPTRIRIHKINVPGESNTEFSLMTDSGTAPNTLVWSIIGLPTSTGGLGTNRIYVDNGFLKIT